jgi:hypothetical protein
MRTSGPTTGMNRQTVARRRFVQPFGFWPTK